ncbi:AAA family ATPase [Thalassotalea hakodatensis]|uniref:AAA family ATPase n=1 Tax=Thalassotalea hakodatensis TaxID=3030492 RepID=UPI0025746814|nr:AAA family ATPase [Thalassotalea hakodatensis]
MSQITSFEFNYCHFNAFLEIDNLKRHDMMFLITPSSLALACCYIDDDNHLQDIISFMSFNQQRVFAAMIKTIQQLPPNPELVVDIQQMIMHIFEHSGQTISILATVIEITGIYVRKESNELEIKKPQPTENDMKRSNSASIFSMKKLKNEVKHRKPKDMQTFSTLIEQGPKKTLYYANKNTTSSLSSLAKSFPNFQDVVDQVIAACQVSQLTNTPLSLPAINLQGHPGIGKTQFVSALAETLNLEFFAINAAAMTGRFELCGGNPQYGDSDLGAIGRIMCFEAKSFQPIILIDELCMAKDNPQDSIIQPLYSFFEREQRKSFKENFLNLGLDLSGAIIFTTTNDFESLKPALKSRLVNMEIEPPTPEHMKAITENMYKHCLKDMKLEQYFNDKLSASLLSTLCQLPPRSVVEKLRLAIGKACVRANNKSRVTLVLEDFKGVDFHCEVGSTAIIH